MIYSPAFRKLPSGSYWRICNEPSAGDILCPHHIAEVHQTSTKRTDDGTFRLDVDNRKNIGVDEALFTDLKSSLEVTNRMIRQDELDTNQVYYVLYRK